MAGINNCKLIDVTIDSRKDLEENETYLFLQRMAYDILTFTLPLCGIPKQMLRSKKREENTFDDIYYEYKASIIVLIIALSRRDQWKRIFESRFKNSGIGMFEKIDVYLKKFLLVSLEFQNSNTLNKVNVSLAAYNEMILFMNYKGVEFDFEFMIVSWSILFKELIAPQAKENEPLHKLVHCPSKLAGFVKWMKSFLKDVAIPYGRSNDVSESFRQHLHKQVLIEAEEFREETKILTTSAPQTTDSATAGETEQVSKSLVTLPWHRGSTEPPDVCCTKNGVNGKDRESRVGSSKPVELLVFESLAVLPDKNKSHETQDSGVSESGVNGKDRESRVGSSKPVEPLLFESLAVLPDKNKSHETQESGVSESGVNGKEGEPRIESSKPVEPLVFESLAVLPDKNKYHETLESFVSESGVNGKDRESRIGSSKPVEPLLFESLAVLPDKNKSHETPESCVSESVVNGKDTESTTLSTGSKDVTVRRKRRRPTVVEFLMESVRRMNLNSLQENNQKD